MAEPQESIATRRARSRKLIEDMLTERQQMLVLLWELSKLDLSKVDQTVMDTLDDFQEILVDYIAAGHFGLYQRIAEGNERRQAVIDTARDTFPRIAQSTDAAVEFTERYETPSAELVAEKLTNDLSRLGEELTTRIEYEDQLILSMLGEDYAIPEA